MLQTTKFDHIVKMYKILYFVLMYWLRSFESLEKTYYRFTVGFASSVNKFNFLIHLVTYKMNCHLVILDLICILFYGIHFMHCTGYPMILDTISPLNNFWWHLRKSKYFHRCICCKFLLNKFQKHSKVFNKLNNY